MKTRKQTSFHFYSLLGIMSLTALGCSPTNPSLHNPPPVEVAVEIPPPVEIPKPEPRPDAVTGSYGNMQIDFQPKVDVLFVIDNSGSMSDDQERLSRNINRFVESFGENELIDFHIGVTSVWDSVTFKDKVKSYQMGELRRVKDRSGKEWPADAPRFVSRSKDYVKVVQQTLKIGVEDFYTQGGPNFEELFTPVIGAFSAPMMTSANKDFLRPDAHLVVILISDADDSSDITASELHAFLRTLKNDLDESRVSTYGVLARAADPESAKDPGLKTSGIGRPVKVENFLRESQGVALHLLSEHYGDDLAEIGREVEARTLRKTIELDALPELGTIEVRYGSQIIPQHEAFGWTYDSKRVAVVINGGVRLRPEAGAQVTVKFTPVAIK